MSEIKNHEEKKHDKRIDFLNYCKINFKFIICLSLFILLAYGILICYYRISFDTHLIINDAEGELRWWLGLGRYSLVFLKKILFLIPFNTYVSNFLMVITIINTCIMIGYIFSDFFRNKRNIVPLLIGVLFFTNPLFADQFYFTLQSFEVALGIFTAFIAFYFCKEWVFFGKGKKNFVLSLVCLVIAFGVYQSIANLYISIVLSYYIMLLISKEFKMSYREIVSSIIKNIIIFFTGFIISFLISFFFQRTYPGGNYLSNQILWQTEPLKVCVKNIYNYLSKMFFSSPESYSNFYLIVCIMIFFVLLVYLFKPKFEKKIIFFLSTFLFLFSPFFITVVMANGVLLRTQFSYAWVIACGVLIIITFIKKMLFKNTIGNAMCVIIVFVIFIQSINIANLFFIDFQRYQRDVEQANAIINNIEELNLNTETEYPIVFIGTIPNDLTKREMIGWSFFEFDHAVKHAENEPSQNYFASSTIIIFMHDIGLAKEYRAPTDQEVKVAEKAAENMEHWPNKGGIEVVDGVIIVNLS